MRSASLLLLAPIVGALTACGSAVTVLGGSDGGGSTTSGTGTTTGTTTGTGTGTTTGTGTSTGTSTGTGTSTNPTCGQTHDTFALKAELFGGQPFGCGGQSKVDMIGQVIESFPGGFTLDSCSPAADCVPLFSYFAFDAVGLYLPLQPDVIVRVQARAEMTFGGCSYGILIANVPNWDGLDNPVTQQKRLWLVAAEGTIGLPPSAPLWIEPLGLGCYPGQEGCGPKEDYLLRFHANAPGTQPVDVPMGATSYWQLGPNTTQVRNLRSYESGDCDDYWNWAFWLNGDPPLEE